MKTLFITALLAITVASCNQKVKEVEAAETTQLPTNYMLVLCILKLLAKRFRMSECGMELTEKVAQGTEKEDANNIDDRNKKCSVKH
jgi:hypothetical protein